MKLPFFSGSLPFSGSAHRPGSGPALAALLACTLMAAADSACAGLDEGVNWYKSNQYVAAVAEFEAMEDDPVAAYFLGLIYSEGGSGVIRDYRMAREYFQKAADKGHVGAQAELGRIFLSGEGARKDYDAARTWLTLAADQGEPAARYNLGIVWLHGLGVTKDPARAAALFEQAATRDYPEALTNLGALYANGEEGVPRDQAKARDYFERAAKQGQTLAMNHLATLISRGEGGEKDPVTASAWLGAAAAMGDARATAPYGEIMRTLGSDERNRSKALTGELVGEARAGLRKASQARMARRLAGAGGATGGLPGRTGDGEKGQDWRIRPDNRRNLPELAGTMQALGKGATAPESREVPEADPPEPEPVAAASLPPERPDLAGSEEEIVPEAPPPVFLLGGTIPPEAEE